MGSLPFFNEYERMMKRNLPISFFAGIATLLALLVFVFLCFSAETPKISSNRSISESKASVKAEVIVPKTADSTVQTPPKPVTDERTN